MPYYREPRKGATSLFIGYNNLTFKQNIKLIPKVSPIKCCMFLYNKPYLHLPSKSICFLLSHLKNESFPSSTEFYPENIGC